jgi:hypothetical protein
VPLRRPEKQGIFSVSTALRRAIFAICTLLWLSGCVWLVAHFAFPARTDFGPGPNPWQPEILRVHGWLAVGSVFLLGWIAAEHITDRTNRARNRVSGYSLASLAAVLVVSGYALYYTTDRLHDIAAVAHEVLGGAAIVFALTHWRRNARSPARP